MNWRDRAACANVDPELFYPEKGGKNDKAKAVCRGCPVKVECAKDALAMGDRWGVWGGLSERERRRLKRRVA